MQTPNPPPRRGSRLPIRADRLRRPHRFGARSSPTTTAPESARLLASPPVSTPLCTRRWRIGQGEYPRPSCVSPIAVHRPAGSGRHSPVPRVASHRLSGCASSRSEIVARRPRSPRGPRPLSSGLAPPERGLPPRAPTRIAASDASHRSFAIADDVSPSGGRGRSTAAAAGPVGIARRIQEPSCHRTVRGRTGPGLRRGPPNMAKRVVGRLAVTRTQTCLRGLPRRPRDVAAAVGSHGLRSTGRNHRQSRRPRATRRPLARGWSRARLRRRRDG